jgi:hypothetical protein
LILLILFTFYYLAFMYRYASLGISVFKKDSIQQQQYEVLVKTHHEAANQLREKIKTAKESFFDNLFNFFKYSRLFILPHIIPGEAAAIHGNINSRS